MEWDYYDSNCWSNILIREVWITMNELFTLIPPVDPMMSIIYTVIAIITVITIAIWDNGRRWGAGTCIIMGALWWMTLPLMLISILHKRYAKTFLKIKGKSNEN